MQQINLYLPEFRAKADLLSAERALALLGIVLLVLIGVQILQVRELNAMRATAVDLEAKQLALKETADQLKKAPKPNKDPALEQEIERLRLAIQNREGVAGIITSRSMGNDTGFSRHLVALGKNKVEGVALRDFTLDSGGAFLRLEGMSQKAELVPLYVSQLQSDDNFKQTKFGSLTLRGYGAGVSFLLSGDGPMDPATLTYFTEEQLLPR
jgi:hypothetical protein